MLDVNIKIKTLSKRCPCCKKMLGKSKAAEYEINVRNIGLVKIGFISDDFKSTNPIYMTIKRNAHIILDEKFDTWIKSAHIPTGHDFYVSDLLNSCTIKMRIGKKVPKSYVSDLYYKPSCIRCGNCGYCQYIDNMEYIKILEKCLKLR